jgi:hypothetical protein
MVDEQMSDEELTSHGFDAAFIDTVRGMIRRNNSSGCLPSLPGWAVVSSL